MKKNFQKHQLIKILPTFQLKGVLDSYVFNALKHEVKRANKKGYDMLSSIHFLVNFMVKTKI